MITLEILPLLIDRHLDALELCLRVAELISRVLRFLLGEERSLLSVLESRLHIVVLLLKLLDLTGMVLGVLLLLFLKQFHVLLQLDVRRILLSVLCRRLGRITRGGLPPESFLTLQMHLNGGALVGAVSQG